MRVPQRLVVTVAISCRSKDRSPLILTRINAAFYSKRTTTIDQRLIPILVIGVWARPILRSLNVQPDTTRPRWVAVWVQIIHQSLHLSLSAGGASRTREEINISIRNSRRFRIIQIAAHVRVDLAIASEAAWHSKGIATAKKTWPPAGWNQRANINAFECVESKLHCWQKKLGKHYLWYRRSFLMPQQSRLKQEIAWKSLLLSALN